MTDIALSIEHLSKSYVVGHDVKKGKGYTALRDVIAQGARNLARKTLDMARGRPVVQGDETEEFWALRDVSFDVRKGEVLGIVGRNGAGKSTLLKVLSRITPPTSGRATIHGRVASLLEVGTGFHPELTGRENVFLNGAILGMRRAEILRKFDEIVSFAEVERFLDTPVKRYSSGMYVRLAFAVAAHLDPEILIVDEVLAVGDAAFQKKCMGKMSDVSRGGRTVLFVSHNMGAIRALTQRGIVLVDGELQLDGTSGKAVDFYMAQAPAGVSEGVFTRGAAGGKGRPPFYVTRVATSARRGGDPSSQFECDQPVHLRVEYAVTRPVPGLYGYLSIQCADGTVVLEGDSFDWGENPLELLSVGEGSIDIELPARLLGHGRYLVYLNFTDRTENVDSPGVVGDFSLDDSRTRRGNGRNGHISAILRWRVEQRESPATPRS